RARRDVSRRDRARRGRRALRPRPAIERRHDAAEGMMRYQALVLHAHLPYVRHPEHPTFLEEDWLFEAITETYLPILDMLDGLARDQVPFALTMSVTPPLCEMLADGLLRERYSRHLKHLVELTEKEVEKKHGTPFEDAALMYRDLFRRSREAYENRYGRDLVRAFRRHREAG